MPSYQDIETRLAIVEAKVDFIMTKMVMQTMEQLPTLDANGNPMIRMTRQTLLEMYWENRDAELKSLATKASRDHLIAGGSKPAAKESDPPENPDPADIRDGEVEIKPTPTERRGPRLVLTDREA